MLISGFINYMYVGRLGKSIKLKIELTSAIIIVLIILIRSNEFLQEKKNGMLNVST